MMETAEMKILQKKNVGTQDLTAQEIKILEKCTKYRI